MEPLSPHVTPTWMDGGWFLIPDLTCQEGDPCVQRMEGAYYERNGDDRRPKVRAGKRHRIRRRTQRY